MMMQERRPRGLGSWLPTTMPGIPLVNVVAVTVPVVYRSEVFRTTVSLVEYRERS